MAVSASLGLIIDMTDPFSGIVRVSSAPLRQRSTPLVVSAKFIEIRTYDGATNRLRNAVRRFPFFGCFAKLLPKMHSPLIERPRTIMPGTRG